MAADLVPQPEVADEFVECDRADMRISIDSNNSTPDGTSEATATIVGTITSPACSTPNGMSETTTTIPQTPTSTAAAIAIAARNFGIDANALRSSVCYHESAHAAVALRFGCKVREVQLTTIPSNPARVDLVRDQAPNKATFIQLTAGPLCDRQRNGHYQFSEAYLREIERCEYQSFERALHRMFPQFNSTQAHALWQDYTNAAREIMAFPRIQAFMDALAARLGAAIEAGEQTVSESEIMALWNQHGVERESTT